MNRFVMLKESWPFGLNIIGYASANLGLGNTLRQFVTSFIERGINICILDLDPGGDRSKFDNRFEYLTVKHALELPYAVNLFIISALKLSDFALYPPKGLQVEGRLNVAFPWWELTDIPKYWVDACQVFDALVTGSEFVHNTFSTHVSDIPILLTQHPVYIPNVVISNRARFQLPENVFLVYTGFEPNSDTVRKNPFSAVEAFTRAFPCSFDCHLVIKVNNANHLSGKNLEVFEKMLALIRSDQRIHLIEECLPYEELLSLYASCDVFISLHRSEGFGLIPLEAMRLGKPVIATAWSGNMSYMNYLNSCLVDFKFVDTEDSYFYSKENLGINTFWAEPDVNQAVAWLQKLFNDSHFRADRGLRAFVDSKQYHEQASKLQFVDELKAIWESREFIPQRNREYFFNKALESRRRLDMSQVQWLFYKINLLFERHILWRFRKGEQ